MLEFRELDCYTGYEGPVCVAFSGGRSSGYMLYHLLEAHGGQLPPNWVVTFQNTGFEMPETLDFVQEFTSRLGVKIIWLEFDHKCQYRLKEVNHNSAARNGEPFIDLFTMIVPKRRDGTAGLRSLPAPGGQRVCTAELKIHLMDRYLRKIAGFPAVYDLMVGFRSDELIRVRRRIVSDKSGATKCGHGIFPMYYAGVDAHRIMEFWRSAPFDLRIESWKSNCDLCFLKPSEKIKRMMSEHPEKAHPWIALEELPRDRWNRFRKDRPSYKELFEQVQAGDLYPTKEDHKYSTCACTD